MSAATAPLPRWLNGSRPVRFGRLPPGVGCAIFTTICLLVTFIFGPSVLPGAYQSASRPPNYQCPSVPPRHLYVPGKRPRFDWRELPPKFPIDGVARLSNAAPRALPQIQHRFGVASHRGLKLREDRRNRVREAFQRCWKSYREYAWLKDELAPVSGKSKDIFGGWAATLVDSLDTLLLMGMEDEFQEAAAAAAEIDFGPDTSSLEEISVLETTSRYLGGFLAAYDLGGCRDTRMLDKAVEVGDMIYAAYDTPNRMPAARWNPLAAADGVKQAAASSGLLAEVGTAGLELTRLSQLTGDMRYYDQAVRIATAMEEQQGQTSLPGVWPVSVNLRAMDFAAGTEYSFGSMSGSAYEVLPKMYALLSGTNAAEQHARMYRTAIEAAAEVMFQRPMLPDDTDVRLPISVRVSSDGRKMVDMRTEHLACSTGGMLALGGRLFGNEEHVALGRQVTDGCMWAYKHSPHGVMPEAFKMAPCYPAEADCTWNETKYREEAVPGLQLGFTAVEDPQYMLRPEVIESVFYLYRITGDERLQEDAWDMFLAIENATHTDLANAAIRDVTAVDVERIDSMESFWMAETLKYFYLMFSEPDLVSLDDFVFNTGAHPLRRPKRG